MSAAIGLDHLRLLRERGQEPSYPVIVSTVGEVCGNLHVHLNPAAHPTDVDWRPVAGLEVIGVVGAGQLKRFLEHAVRLLRYDINRAPGQSDLLYVWDIDRKDGVVVRRSKPIRTPYHELNRPEEIDVYPMSWLDKVDMQRQGFERDQHPRG